MSLNLTLTKTVRPSRKGEKPKLVTHAIRQTPTDVTLACRAVISDRWRVFVLYARWFLDNELDARGAHMDGASPYALQVAREHLDGIQRALEEGFEWSWI